LAVIGPLENADLVGTELTRSIHSYVLPALNRETTPSPYLDRLIEEGRLGFKSGEGFRQWTPQEQTALRERVTKHLKASFGAPHAIEE
jgi:3-hydroxybutyryl-CoA dehydrogenase